MNQGDTAHTTMGSGYPVDGYGEITGYGNKVDWYGEVTGYGNKADGNTGTDITTDIRLLRTLCTRHRGTTTDIWRLHTVSHRDMTGMMTIAPMSTITIIVHTDTDSIHL
jgi:hypothetical protein